jgi:uncharacterized protein
MLWGPQMRLSELLAHGMRGAVIAAVRTYQRTLSRVLPPSCRFEPSCSQYMIDAVGTHGVLRGLALGVWRVLRCNPWNPGGYDPVPGWTPPQDPCADAGVEATRHES